MALVRRQHPKPEGSFSGLKARGHNESALAFNQYANRPQLMSLSNGNHLNWTDRTTVFDRTSEKKSKMFRGKRRRIKEVETIETTAGRRGG